MNNSELFISYAWGGESEQIVNEIDNAFADKGIKIIRDKRDLGFKGVITDFMNQIGAGKAVIVVISDKYLKSPYCMYELLEIYRNLKFRDRIFPIVLSDAGIFEPMKRLEYLKHWQDKKNELDNAITQFGADAITVIGDDYKTSKKIFDNFGEVVNILKDINSLTPQMHREGNFRILFDAVEKLLTNTINETSIEKNESIKKLKGKTYHEIIDVVKRKRVEMLQKQIDYNLTLLEGYENQETLSSDTKEKMRAEKEIKQITERLQKIQEEINSILTD